MKIKTKALLAGFIASLSLAALAQPAAPGSAPVDKANPPPFAVKKAHLLDHLQKMTQCVTQANSDDDLKACHDKNPPPMPHPGGQPPMGQKN